MYNFKYQIRAFCGDNPYGTFIPMFPGYRNVFLLELKFAEDLNISMEPRIPIEILDTMIYASDSASENSC